MSSGCPLDWRRVPQQLRPITFLALAALMLISIVGCAGPSSSTSTNNHTSRASGSVYYFALQPGATPSGSSVPIGAVVARDASTGAQLWSDPVNAELATIVASKSAAFVGRGYLQVFRASDGKQVWSATASSRMVPLAVTDSAVFISDVTSVRPGEGSSIIEALNTAGGTLKWRTIVSGEVTRATLDDGILYAFAAGPFGAAFVPENLMAVDAATGTVLWQVAAGFAAGPYFFSVSNGTVYVFELQVNAGSGPFTTVLHAVKASDGASLWTRTFTGDFGTGAASGEVIVAAVSSDNVGDPSCPANAAPGGSSTDASSCVPPTTLIALSPTDGSQLWRAQLADEYLDSPVVADSSHLYLALIDSNGSSEIESFDVADGKLSWSDPVPESEPIIQISGSALIVASTPYLSEQGSPSDGIVEALNTADGSVLWQVPVGDAQVYPMVVVPGT